MGRKTGRGLAGAAAAVGLLASAGLHARELLQRELGDKVAAHWIYDDWGKAVAEARATSKPILAVLRCVP